jgi:hypothetical protein
MTQSQHNFSYLSIIKPEKRATKYQEYKENCPHYKSFSNDNFHGKKRKVFHKKKKKIYGKLSQSDIKI